MKIVFLDIDGVLYTQKDINKDKEKGNNLINFNSNSMENLKKIIETTNAKIIISSTRRIHKKENNFLWKELIRNFNIYSLNKEIIDITSYREKIISSKNKSNEIKEWLENNKILNIEKFVIIDDEVIEGFNSFIKCNSYIGISENEKIEILNKLF